MTKETVYWVIKNKKGEYRHCSDCPDCRWITDRSRAFRCDNESDARWVLSFIQEGGRIVRVTHKVKAKKPAPSGEITIGKRRFKLVEITPAEK